MADDENPYQAPRSLDDPIAPAPPSRRGIWRQRNMLVVGRDATLPDICPITNLPAEIRWPTKVRVLVTSRLACSLIFCPPLGVLGYGIYLLEGTYLVIPLRRQILARRRFHRRNAVALGLVACGLFAGHLLNWAPQAGFIGEGLAAWGWALLLVVACYDCVMTSYFTVDHLTADHIWVVGACPEYLDRFEEFPV